MAEEIKRNKKLIFLKIFASFLIFVGLTFCFLWVSYFKLLPRVVSHQRTSVFVQKYLKKSMGLDLVVKNPVLVTADFPYVSFKVDGVKLEKDGQPLLYLNKFDSMVSLGKLHNKKIILNKLGADYIFIDLETLSKLKMKEGESKKSDWKVDLFYSELFVKKLVLIYAPKNEMKVKLVGKNMQITPTRNPKYLHFDVNVNIVKNNHSINLSFSDKNSIYTKNRKVHIDNFIFKINNSSIIINAIMDERIKYDLNFSATKFDIKNIVDLIDSNLIIPNGHDILSCLKNIKGDVDFKVNIKPSGINGNIYVNKLFFNLVLLNSVPINVAYGEIVITPKTIKMDKFKGYYGKSSFNGLRFKGTIDDYTKSVKTKLVILGKITDDFTEHYLSKIIGVPVKLTDKSYVAIKFESIYNKIDIGWVYAIKKGGDIIVDGMSVTPKNYDRVLKGDMHFENNIMTIKSIDYHIAKIIKRKSVPDPVVTIKGELDFNKGIVLKELCLDVPKPLPSEFYNLFLGQRFFKKGTIGGKIAYINRGKYPVLNGDIAISQVRVPSQRLSIKQGRIVTKNDIIDIQAEGRYRKAKYKFKSLIKNALVFPVVIKDTDLSIEKLDIEKIMKTFNNQSADNKNFIDEKAKAEMVSDNIDLEDEPYTFNTNIIVVEKCMLNVIQGSYKQINFGNLHANLTLDKNGILEVKSNRFDFAEGISSAKVYCDLKRHKYFIKLGSKNVDSDVIATSLLNLSKEISGRASAIIELNSDDSMVLNGSIKFIIKNGTISKLGLVEYALKMAALFRNPIVMISPGTIIDLVNIPEGTFDRISGNIKIKNNVINKIDIKSSSEQLASFVVGRYDLVSKDASLRIYTKFSSKNKGFAGFLRNFSLNKLAGKTNINRRNEINYYASEIEQIPKLEQDNEEESQIFLTTVDGDVEHNNFISSLKKLK